MDAEFWLERWRRGEIGWHRDEVNPWLVAHADRLPTGARIFIPLCGKTLDAGWLRARGHAVVGVDLSPLAAEAMFAEADWPSARERRGDFEVWRTTDDGPQLEFWVGDLFALDAISLRPVDAVWDRAAYHALPPDLRVRYVEHLQHLVPPAAPMLLVTIEYPEGARQGPPFPIEPREVRRLWAAGGRPVVELGKAGVGGRYSFDVPVREDVWWLGPVGADRG